jgi:hypothetical protein
LILRIWRTGVDSTRWDAYAQFEREHSTPMFQSQPGCLAVFFVRLSAVEAAACTLWQNQDAIDQLAGSSSYQRTVAQLQATGLLQGAQQVEVMPIVGGWLAIEQLQALSAAF